MNAFKFLSVNLLIILGLFTISSAQNELSTSRNTSEIYKLKQSNCRYEYNGKVYDLTSLDKPSNPRQTSGSGFYYKYNPCSPITCGTFSTVAICQTYMQNPADNYNLGDQSSIEYSYDGSNLVMTFKATQGSVNRISNLKCICQSTENFKFIREDVVAKTSTYYLEFYSPCCCPDGCGSKPAPSGDGSGLSFGSILLIIFFSLLVVYFLGGFIFLKFYKNSSGIETIPNHSFWMAIPGNIKDGFLFVKRKIRPADGYQSV